MASEQVFSGQSERRMNTRTQKELRVASRSAEANGICVAAGREVDTVILCIHCQAVMGERTKMKIVKDRTQGKELITTGGVVGQRVGNCSSVHEGGRYSEMEETS